jgi:hypothetical protein
MSEASVHSVERVLRETAVQAAWTQWTSLGGGGLRDSEGAPSSIVDPEALLLLSLYFIPAERRLRDLVRWGAETGAELFSVQRMKTLLDEFPPETSERLPDFAYWAVEAGDKRWRQYAAEDPPSSPGRERKGRDRLTLRTPSSLLLRLRSGIGVGAKADVLGCLLGIRESPATTREVTRAAAYSRATVRGALKGLSRAGFIEEQSGRPARYVAPVRPWMDLLWAGGVRPDDPPSWRHWGSLFAFLAHGHQWARTATDQSEYVMSTRARDVFEAHEKAFEANRIPTPDPDHHPGKEYVHGFARLVDALAQWIPDHL